jgi:hypothetical protein
MNVAGQKRPGRRRHQLQAPALKFAVQHHAEFAFANLLFEVRVFLEHTGFVRVNCSHHRFPLLICFSSMMSSLRSQLLIVYPVFCAAILLYLYYNKEIAIFASEMQLFVYLHYAEKK